MTAVAVDPVPTAPVLDDLRALAAYAGATDDVDGLADTLYREWYLGLRPAAPRTGPLTPLDVDPVPALLAAHAGAVRFEDGWRAVRVSSAGRVQAVRGDDELVLGPGEYVGRSRPGRPARPGDLIAVRGARGAVEHGCWVSRSTRWDGSGRLLTRLYVDVAPDGVPAAVALLTGALERAPGGYAIKVFLDLHLTRPDSVVVYVPRDHWHDEVGALLAGPLAELAARGLLRPATPRLTVRLREGVAVADGSPSGESHGAERCALLATALASLPVDPGEPALLAAVRAAFAAAGLDPDRPHLDPGSTRDYLP